MKSFRRSAAVLGAAAFLLAACGGDDKGSSDTTAAPTTVTPEGGDTTMAPDTTAAEAPSDLVPGDVEYRVVNLLDEPVDVYVRTQGVVEAWLMEEGVAPGAVTDLYAPPAEGTFLVTTAGGGDPECVIDCPHFIAELTAFDTDGPVHTVVLYDNAGTPASFDLWEQAPGGSGNANEMVAADPAMGTVVITAIALTDADFGLRVGFDGVSGCQEPANLTGVLVGGNQTPAYLYDGSSVDVTLYANTDRECATEVAGGPYTITGGPGTRTHLMLFGSADSMEAIILPMVGDEDAAANPGEGDGGVDPALAVELLATDLEADPGLPADQAVCAAELVVEAVGPDVLVVDGELIDPADLNDEDDAAVVDALIASVDECGIDPAMFGF